MLKRGKDGAKLRAVMQDLIDEVPLLPLHQDHKLKGEFIGRRECHIEFDWVVVYKIEGDTIIFERTGTHADLFD